MEMEQLEFAVESIQLPELKSNFEKFKAELVLAVEQFKIEVTEDNIAEAKKMMASLNKIKANITQKSKETVAIFKKPVDSFRQQISELENICDVSRADIAFQVQKFEDETKAECERLLIKLINELRSDYKIEKRFYSAKYDDCIKLGSVTAKGGLTKTIKEAILYRVDKEKFNQNLYHGRYKEVESECLKMGVQPFTETSVAHILVLDYDEFKQRLIASIHAEIDRNEKFKAKVEADAKVKAEKEAKEKQDEENKKKAIEENQKRIDDAKAKVIAENESKIKSEIDSGKRTASGAIIIEHKEPEKVYTSYLKESEQDRHSQMNQAIKEIEEKKVRRIRPSSLPRIFACTNSRHAPELEIEEKFAGNIEGVALHKFSEKYFTSENTDIKAIIGEVEDFYKVDVAYLCWNLAKMLLKYRAMLKDVKAEQKLSAEIKSGLLVGTMDLNGFADKKRAVVIDVKAGFGGNDYTAQLKGYMLLMFRNNPELEKVAIITAYASTSKIKTETYTREDSEKFEIEIDEIYSGKKNGYNVGDNCTYCPLRYECTAKQGVLNGTIASLLENETTTIDIEMLEKINLIDKAIKKFKELFKQKVESEGEVRIGINTYYIAKDIKEKLVLTPESFEYLHSIFGSQMTKFLSISETELKELKMSEAPKGLKIAEWRAFFEELNKKGFTEKVVTERISKK
jgi:hypothetical protein